MISGAFGAPNGLRDVSLRSQAVLDIFLSFDLPFPSMIDGKIESKTPTRPAKPKTKFLFLPFRHELPSFMIEDGQIALMARPAIAAENQR